MNPAHSNNPRTRGIRIATALQSSIAPVHVKARIMSSKPNKYIKLSPNIDGSQRTNKLESRSILIWLTYMRVKLPSREDVPDEEGHSKAQVADKPVDIKEPSPVCAHKGSWELMVGLGNRCVH